MSEFKMCPLMIGKEERKAITYAQCDRVVPIMYPCIGAKCMAYDGGGMCRYWMKTVKLDKPQESEVQE